MVSAILEAMGLSQGADKPRVRYRLVPRRSAAWPTIDLAELWRYRDLLALLALRDIQVRYKQTALGALWALIQPVVTMVIFTVFFGAWLGVPRMSDPVFVYAGLLPWTLFSAAVSAAASSVVGNADIMRKVYFPRLVLPLAATGAPIVDYAVAMGVLVVLMPLYGSPLTWQLMLVPALAASTLIAAIGVGVMLAAVTVSFRDFRHVVPFMLQVWFFLTPVLYPQAVIPERFRMLANVNPMTGIIEATRAAVLGTPIDYSAWAASLIVSLTVLIIGVGYFARVERRFADIV
jgi:lipopolysaccharide transport system permease protein